jgi:TrmH family RNA methyltransferase
MVITSRANQLVKKIIALSDKKYRREYGEYLVEGIKPVTECIAAGKEVTLVLCTEDLSAQFKDATIVSDGVFSYISTEKSPQGVIAVVKIPDCSVKKPIGNCVLLDKLQDPGNVGTIIRTANAAGYDDIYMVNCADVFSPKAVRASMSGVFFVNIHIGTYEEIAKALQGFKFITADLDGENIFDFTAPENYCLCIGNEGNGISKEVKALSDYTVKIPMRQSCESLNAAISAAIAMYALKNNKK